MVHYHLIGGSLDGLWVHYFHEPQLQLLTAAGPRWYVQIHEKREACHCCGDPIIRMRPATAQEAAELNEKVQEARKG